MKTFVILWVLFLSSGCAPTPSKKNPELVVAAAANLTDAFTELGQRFTQKTGIKVVFSFGSTADLARQIENGAPFDVFAAADSEHVDQLERQGLLTPGTRTLYARGRLVMWVRESTLRITRIEDVASKEFERIAIPKPDVAPYGQAALESLRALGVWPEIENRVIYGQNVSQTKQFVATGNAEVAFIPLSLVKPGEGTYVEVDGSLHRPIDQALGIIRASEAQSAARQFVDYLLSKEGKELLVQKGFYNFSG